MKRIFAGFLALLMLLSIVGCGKDQPPEEPLPTQESVETVPEPEEIETEPPTEPTEPIALEEGKFPEGTALYGVDVSGMGQTEALAALQAAVDAYSLNLNVNGTPLILSAETLQLSLSQEEYDAYFTALTGGQTLPVPELLSFSESSIRQAVVNRIGVPVRNASIRYSASAGAFEIQTAAEGISVEPAPAVKAAGKAIAVLKTTAKATVTTEPILPTVTEDSPELLQGKNLADEYLQIKLSYTYAPEDAEAQTQALTKADIAGFITFDSQMKPVVDKEAVADYAGKMNDKYQTGGEKGNFVTTGGATINMTVTYAGQLVDVDALTADIYSCVTGRVSGTRTAPYSEKSENAGMAYGGNYVEVNMNAQYLWVYKNGKCVVSTPIVTGCAFEGNSTPRGVYKINRKARNVTLYGSDYASNVKYWIPFIRGVYGLHDASWRSEFGGNEYLYNGSHGCVNMPPSITGKVYDNVSVGTHVILYGGATKADPLQQTLKGTPSVSTSLDTPVKLDVQPEYAVDTLTYTVADPSVLEVSADGTVTPKAVGATTVTVTSPKQRFYTEATFTVTVTVTDPCQQGRHSCSAWTVQTAPTCGQPGTETGICDRCGQPATRDIPATGEHTPATKTTEAGCTAPGQSITYCSVCDQELGREDITPATGHSFAEGQADCANGCGEKNPDYVAPTEPPTEPPKEETDPEE